MKRAFDVIVAALGLVVVSPLMVAVALAILATDGPPILFRQERCGRRASTFTILKFRTMRHAAGPAITVGADSRITAVGAVLRRFKLDELPQLLNVLRGEMSLVGYRPELPAYVRAHPDLFRPVHDRRPGMTDPASLAYRDEAERLATSDDPERLYTETILPDKLRISADYAASATLVDDVVIIMRTVIGRH